MNMEVNRQRVQGIKAMYPKGTRIELTHMNDTYAPIPPGTRGTVDFVDDIGTLHMKWSNGRTLGVVPCEDSFRKLTQEEIETESQDQDEDSGMSMNL